MTENTRRGFQASSLLGPAQPPAPVRDDFDEPELAFAWNFLRANHAKT